MDELLTTKQVQEYLQVDRTTIYRMLNDGRLTATKVGKQWRFPSSQIKAILAESLVSPEEDNPPITPEVLPIHCVQVVQDVFAEVAGVGSVTTTKEGEPLTDISNSCQFCNLILASEKGYQACINTWKNLSSLPPTAEVSFFTCHAGMQYAHSRINIDSEFSALLIAGQFHLDNGQAEQTADDIQELAGKYDIDTQELTEAAGSIPVLDKRIKDQIGRWIHKVAVTFGQIGSERAELMGRLNRIAEITKLDV